MRKVLFGLAALALVAAGAVLHHGSDIRAFAQNVACYMEQGGASWNAGSGCTWTVRSGGVLNVASGGQLQIAGVDKTSALAAGVTAPVAGVAASYKIARGETALDGSNPTDAATGLASIVACTVGLKKTTAPTPTLWLSYTTATATLSLYGWRSTANNDTTPTASEGTETVGWVCVGT